MGFNKPQKEIIIILTDNEFKKPYEKTIINKEMINSAKLGNKGIYKIKTKEKEFNFLVSDHTNNDIEGIEITQIEESENFRNFFEQEISTVKKNRETKEFVETTEIIETVESKESLEATVEVKTAIIKEEQETTDADKVAVKDEKFGINQKSAILDGNMVNETADEVGQKKKL